MDYEIKWWATLESNQAWVSPAELQSAAAPCSSSPDAKRGIADPHGGVKGRLPKIGRLFACTIGGLALMVRR